MNTRIRICLTILFIISLLTIPAWAGRVDTAFNPSHLKAINRVREEHGLQPVTMSRVLNQAIGIRAREQVELFGHQRPDGTACWTVLDEVDPSFKWSPTGENCYSRGISTVDQALKAG